MNNHDISSYYPSGQRKLEKQGVEYNFENFIDNFSNRIKTEDLVIIESNDTTRIEQVRISKLGLYSLCHTLLRISEAVLTAIVVCLVVTLPYYSLVQQGSSIVDYNLLGNFIRYAIIIFLASLVSTIILRILEIKLRITLEAIRIK